MHDATSQTSSFRLAIAPGVPSSHLSALLALQREEEPEVTIAFFEVAGDELVAGLRDGRYDAGISLEGLSDPPLKSQPLWSESMAVAIFRWQAEICPLLDQRLSSLMPANRPNTVQSVTSFEMMALWVAAGYGVEVSAQSRIGHAHGWGIGMRPLFDGPYEIVTHLQRLDGQVNPVSDRFERRALQIAKVGAT